MRKVPSHIRRSTRGKWPPRKTGPSTSPQRMKNTARANRRPSNPWRIRSNRVRGARCQASRAPTRRKVASTCRAMERLRAGAGRGYPRITGMRAAWMRPLMSSEKARILQPVDSAGDRPARRAEAADAVRMRATRPVRMARMRACPERPNWAKPPTRTAAPVVTAKGMLQRLTAGFSVGLWLMDRSIGPGVPPRHHRRPQRAEARP